MKFALLAVAALLLAGCASTTAGTSIDGQWTLVSGTDATGALTLDPAHPITLEVGAASDANSSGGVAACNSYGTTWDGERFTEINQTEMACSPVSVMELESRYLAALSAVTSASASDGLVLTGPSIELQFEVTPAAASVPFVGTEWVLVSISNGDDPDATVSSPPDNATFTFSDDGMLEAHLCNLIGGTYELDGAHLTVTGMSQTLMGCSTAVAEQEQQMRSLLADATCELPTTLNSAQLVLTGADGTVAKFTAR